MTLSPAPAPAEPLLFARVYAIRLGLVLLVGFAAIIAFSGYDESHRGALETFEEKTAVGDRAFFSLPVEALKPPPAAVVFQGQPLFPVSYQIIEVRDSKMIRAGMAEDVPLRVYVPREPLPPLEGQAEKAGQRSYYLKVNRDEFIQVRPGSPEK